MSVGVFYNVWDVCWMSVGVLPDGIFVLITEFFSNIYRVLGSCKMYLLLLIRMALALDEWQVGQHEWVDDVSPSEISDYYKKSSHPQFRQLAKKFSSKSLSVVFNKVYRQENLLPTYIFKYT